MERIGIFMGDWLGSQKERENWEGQDVDFLHNIKMDLGVVVMLALMLLRTETSELVYEHGNEPSGSIEHWEFVQW